MSSVNGVMDSREWRRQILMIAGGIGPLWIYLLIVGVLDEAVLGVSVRLGHVALAAVGGLDIIGWLAARGIRTRQWSRHGVLSASMLSVATVLSMTALDIA